RRDHLRDVGGSVAGTDAEDAAAEAADLIAVQLQEGGGRDDHAAGRTASGQVERPADDADDAHRRVRSCWPPAIEPGLELLDLSRCVGVELQDTADPQVEPSGEDLADGDLVRSRGPWDTTGHDPSAVD